MGRPQLQFSLLFLLVVLPPSASASSTSYAVITIPIRRSHCPSHSPSQSPWQTTYRTGAYESSASVRPAIFHDSIKTDVCRVQMVGGYEAWRAYWFSIT